MSITRRLLSTSLLTAIVTLVAAGAQAQSVMAVSYAEESDPRSDEHRTEGQPWVIVGSWFGTTTTGIRQLLTFHADGTVLRSVPGEMSIDPARPPHTAAHGVWQYLGKGRFGVTLWDIFYDISTSQLLRYNKLRIEVTLTGKADEGTGRATIEVIDPNGVVLATRTGGLSLVRIPFEPLE